MEIEKSQETEVKENKLEKIRVFIDRWKLFEFSTLILSLIAIFIACYANTRIEIMDAQYQPIVNTFKKQQKKISEIEIQFASLNERISNIKSEFSFLNTKLNATFKPDIRIDAEELKSNKGFRVQPRMNFFVENLGPIATNISLLVYPSKGLTAYKSSFASIAENEKLLFASYDVKSPLYYQTIWHLRLSYQDKIDRFYVSEYDIKRDKVMIRELKIYQLSTTENMKLLEHKKYGGF